MSKHRRQFLRLCGVAGIGALAGCSDGSQDGETPTSDEATATATASPAAVQPPGQRAKLAANDGDGVDNFGYAVALSSDGTTAVIGARRDEDPSGDRSGSAYVFDGSGGSWTQGTKIVPADGDSSDNFGTAAAVSGDGTTFDSERVPPLTAGVNRVTFTPLSPYLWLRGSHNRVT